MEHCILVLTNSIGGLHSFRKEVMKAMIDVGYKVVISAPVEQKDEVKASYFSEIGCVTFNTIFNRKNANPFKDLQLFVKYISIIKKFKPSVILTYTIKPNIYGGMAGAVCGVPQFANITGLGSTLENPGMMQKLNIMLYRIGLRKTKLVFFQNQENRQFCIDNKMVMCRNVLLPGSGVNLDYHTSQTYPTDDGVIRFIFISRILKDKGVDELFSAIANVKKRHGEKVEFNVLGNCEENYSKQLSALHNEGIIIYHGAHPDVRPYVAKSHCLILPSYHEGMSNVLQEASAAARPVITCNVSGCKEIVNDKETGLLCRVKDAEDLESKIEEFIALPYGQKEAMGNAARSKMEREFNRTIVVDKYLKEIDQLLTN